MEFKSTFNSGDDINDGVLSDSELLYGVVSVDVLSGEYEFHLVEGESFPGEGVLHGIDGGFFLDVEGDSFSSEGLSENLHCSLIGL